MEVDAFVEDRIRLAAEHGDLVAEGDQLAGEVAGIHALAARMGVAAVSEVGDSQGAVSGHEATSVSVG